MDDKASYTISHVARRSGLSVRALRHYDEIALLKPSARSAAGYRLYSARDVLRLQRILAQRELGFSLEEIKAQLDEPDYDMRAALRSQRERVAAQVEASRNKLEALERALAMLEAPGQPVDLREIFDGFDAGAYEAEAQARWGHTDAFAESKRRTARYGAEDWRRIRAEQDDILAAFARAHARGLEFDDTDCLQVAERHRLHIDRHYYPCARSMHAQLAELYTQDPRFAAYFDAEAPGLAIFVAEVIRANVLARGDG